MTAPRLDAFAALVHGAPRPMYIVTVDDGAGPDGCLVGFTSQASIHPPRFLVCLSVLNATHQPAMRAGHLGVHLVPAGRTDLAELFGGTTADRGARKFDRCRWSPGLAGVPLLEDCPIRMVGAVLDRHPLGDHTGFLLEPVDVTADQARAALATAEAAGIHPGHPAD